MIILLLTPYVHLESWVRVDNQNTQHWTLKYHMISQGPTTVLANN